MTVAQTETRRRGRGFACLERRGRWYTHEASQVAAAGFASPVSWELARLPVEESPDTTEQGAG